MTDVELVRKKLAQIELFDVLAAAGWIEPGLGTAMRRAVGLRSLLVHGYAAVDPKIVRDVVENRLSDVDGFVASVRARIGAS